ncbi:MAG: prepilin-type N-terminal cleavage/methylation domain-containing protein [Bdellovibrionaceae bacterium]|nr:prepilin-type N-terminal cleavage/methylation domain-containing protein [Pseudobdellovibrionaceae bacterium]
MSRQSCNRILSEDGFSLIEMVIASGILLVLALGMSSFYTTMSKENSALQQKLNTLELEQAVVRLLGDADACSCMFSGLAMGTINSNIDLSTPLKNGCSSDILIAPDKPISASSSVTVNTIQLKNLKVIAPGRRGADLEVSFSNTVRALKPITIPSLGFEIAAGKVTQCVGTAGAQKLCQDMGGIWDTTSSKCQMPSDIATLCAKFGGTYSSVSGSCQLPTATASNTTGTPTATATSNMNCPKSSCYIDLSFSNYQPGAKVTFSGKCTYPDPGTGATTTWPGSESTNKYLGTISSAGSYSYTGMWPCGSSPNVTCSQSYAVDGATVASNMWKCPP